MKMVVESLSHQHSNLSTYWPHNYNFAQVFILMFGRSSPIISIYEQNYNLNFFFVEDAETRIFCHVTMSIFFALNWWIFFSSLVIGFSDSIYVAQGFKSEFKKTFSRIEVSKNVLQYNISNKSNTAHKQSQKLVYVLRFTSKWKEKTRKKFYSTFISSHAKRKKN